MKDEVASVMPVWPPWEAADVHDEHRRECGWDRIRLAHVDGSATNDTSI